FSLLLHLLPRPPRPTPFPYTTLFRSPFEQPAVAALGRIDLEQQAAARRIDVVARAAAVVEDHAIDRERPRRMVTEVVGVLGRQQLGVGDLLTGHEPRCGSLVRGEPERRRLEIGEGEPGRASGGVVRENGRLARERGEPDSHWAGRRSTGGQAAGETLRVTGREAAA